MPGLRISVAFPASWKQLSSSFSEGETLLARRFIVVSFETEPITPPETDNPQLLPNFAPAVDAVAALLSVLFGKRIDSHGFLQRHGVFHIPDLESLEAIHLRALPFNSSDPRPDLPIDLNLDNAKLIAPLLAVDSALQDTLSLFYAAAALYRRAHASVQQDPQLAFLDLVAALEVLSSFYNFSPDELLDAQTRADFHQISLHCPEGVAVTKRLQSRLFQVRRRFAKTILRLLTPRFFEATEAKQDWPRLRAPLLGRRLLAAYDIRSIYLHTGAAFGQHIMPSRYLNEIAVGTPVLESSKLAKALSRSPTLSGLERICRYCLLRFLHLNALPVHVALDGPGLDGTAEV